MELLGFLGLLLGLWLALRSEERAGDDYAKGMDEYRVKMREIHGKRRKGREHEDD